VTTQAFSNAIRSPRLVLLGRWERGELTGEQLLHAMLALGCKASASDSSLTERLGLTRGFAGPGAGWQGLAARTSAAKGVLRKV
jgi:hypothetical protein